MRAKEAIHGGHTLNTPQGSSNYNFPSSIQQQHQDAWAVAPLLSTEPLSGPAQGLG